MDQSGDPTQQHVLIRIENAVDIDDLPQHLDDLEAIFTRELSINLSRKWKILGRLLDRRFGGLDQRTDDLRTEIESLREHTLDSCALAYTESVVHARRLNKEGCNSELKLIGTGVRGRGCATA